MKILPLIIQGNTTLWFAVLHALGGVCAVARQYELDYDTLPNPLVTENLSSSITTTAANIHETISSSSSLPTTPVTTTALPESSTPAEHWTPDRPDPFVCEYLGENDCWRPQYPQGGPPYMHSGEWPARSKVCSVEAGNDPDGDDAPAILKAFADCKEDGHVVFENTTYYVGTVMNTTGLKNVDVEVKGTLLWSTDVDYWLNNSLPVGFQNQSSAWYLGGDDLHFYGHGYGTLDGNGQVWYDYAKGEPNIHGRPHAITISDTTNSVVEGLRFVQSQMWTMTLARSERVLLQDIYVNSTSEPRPFRGDINTDGCDTVYANDITFLRWTVKSGDDSISMKQNSTNVYIANCTFYHGLSLAMGTVGQYPGQINVIENVTAEDIVCHNTRYAGRVKSFAGVNVDVPPNGGGGGLGHAKNISWTNFVLDQVENPWHISQCTSYDGPHTNGCSSGFQISEMNWGNAVGTVTSSAVADLQCSGNAPCGVHIFDADVAFVNGTVADEFLCQYVDAEGFECTGST